MSSVLLFMTSNAYLVEGWKDGRPVLMAVDSGVPNAGENEKILQAVRGLGYDAGALSFIFITHAHLDHYGSAGMLRAYTGAEVIVHEEDARDMAMGLSPLGDIAVIEGPEGILDIVVSILASVFLPPTPPDRVVQDGDSLEAYGFAAEVVHLPGHTRGHSGLLVFEAGGLGAITGDLITSEGEDPHVQRSFADDWDQICDSVRKLQAIGPAVVYPGHGTPFAGEVLEGLPPCTVL
jgi:glyoxylase-like metal-dependent hydrolase (beta-lactamase superfamily II)